MKNVVITGGAGYLGKALTEKFISEGYRVLTLDIVEMENFGKEHFHYLCDVTKVYNIERTFKDIHERFGFIDILINNAGVTIHTPMMERTWEEFDMVMKINCYGTFFSSKESLKYMKGGSIINIGSIYGIVSPDPNIYGDSGENSPEVYGMSKAGIIQLTKYLAVHTPRNIQVVTISPGGIYKTQSATFIKRYEKKTPMGRMATRDEVVRLIFLVADSNITYLNGANIPIDGGLTAW